MEPKKRFVYGLLEYYRNTIDGPSWSFTTDTTVTMSGSLLQVLNQLGEEGWETSIQNGLTIYLKQAKI
jgi:hypothetical protein